MLQHNEKQTNFLISLIAAIKISFFSLRYFLSLMHFNKRIATIAANNQKTNAIINHVYHGIMISEVRGPTDERHEFVNEHEHCPALELADDIGEFISR